MVLLVTGAVFVLPVVAVWELRSSGAVTSLWLLLLIAIAISQAVSWLLRAYWTHSMHRTDLLFSELLIWGWLWHLRSERRLASAARILRTLEHEGSPTKGILKPADSEQARRWRVLRQLASAVDAQDIYLHGHSRRVARHAEMVGRRMRLSSPELARLRAAAAAHDVGKLAVPRAILDKPGELTEEEFASVKRHADEGARLVAVLGDPEITAIVRHHHERVDGHGYPLRLVGREIPLGARIVAVADTFDAITSERPYRPAAQHKQAITTLKECAGTQLDSYAVDAFLASYAGRRQTFVLAALLAAPQQALARIVGGRTSSFGSSAANGLAIVAVAAAVAAAAGTPSSAAAPFAISSHMVASVPGLGGVVAALHVRRSHGAATSSGVTGKSGSGNGGNGSPGGGPGGGSGPRGGGGGGNGGGGKGGGGNGGGGGQGGGNGGGNGAGGGGPPGGGGGGRPGGGGHPGGGGNPGGGTPGGGGGNPGGGGGGNPGGGGGGTPGGGGGGNPGRGGGTPGGGGGGGTPGGGGGGAPGGGGGGTPGGGGGGGPPPPPPPPTPTPLGPGNTTCAGMYGGHGDSVVVPGGATCTLVSGTQVGHDVVVDPGGTLISQGATIGHDLRADGAAGLSICGTNVEHDLHVDGASGAVTVGDGGGCAGNTVGHDLTVQGGAVTVVDNQVGHDLRVEGSGDVSGNNVGHDASCQGVNASSNNAGHKNGC
jgi:hypothetical protein